MLPLLLLDLYVNVYIFNELKMAKQKDDLQRVIERHMKMNADQLKYFSNQIKNLKVVAPKTLTRVQQRPCCKSSEKNITEGKHFQKPPIKQPKLLMRDQKVRKINVINI